MIQSKEETVGGVAYIHTSSDAGYYIQRDGERYVSAMDPVGSARTYQETAQSVPPTRLSGDLMMSALELLAGTDVETMEQVESIREQVECAADLLPDGDAAKCPGLTRAWRAGETVEAGERRCYAGVLYKALQGHTTQADWTPGQTPALWVVVEVGHAGTLEDPIPASRGMEYTYGTYYGDPEDGKTYLCQRTGEAAGGTIVLHYLPHELVGQYFVSAE